MTVVRSADTVGDRLNRGNVAMVHRLVLPIVLALVALLLGPGSVAAKSSGPSCISTPEEFVAAWDSRSTGCVSPDLMGTVHVRGAQRPYPKGFWRAWAVGNYRVGELLDP